MRSCEKEKLQNHSKAGEPFPVNAIPLSAHILTQPTQHSFLQWDSLKIQRKTSSKNNKWLKIIQVHQAT